MKIILGDLRRTRLILTPMFNEKSLAESNYRVSFDSMTPRSQSSFIASPLG